ELARPPRATLVIRQGRHRGRRGGNPRKLIEIKRVRARKRRHCVAPARPVSLEVDPMGNGHSTAACLPWPQEVLHMLTDTEMLTTLRQHPLLAGLAEGTFQEVCRLAIQRRLETGECLLHQGKPADRFYVLIQGQMKLTRVLMEGQEKLVEIVQPGQSFGEALMFAEQNLNPFSASALKPCLLASLDATHFPRLLQEQPQLCMSLLGRFRQRMHHILEEIDTLAMANASQRVALVREDEQQPAADVEQLRVVTRQIASHLEIQPPSLSAIHYRMMDAGLTAIESRTIPVLDKLDQTGYIQYRTDP